MNKLKVTLQQILDHTFKGKLSGKIIDFKKRKKIDKKANNILKKIIGETQ